MKFDDIKVGQRVKDYLFGQFRIGKVIKKLKTRVKIVYNFNCFSKDEVTYDEAHIQFLTKLKDK